MLVYHRIAVNHRINFDNCAIGYVEHQLKQVIEIKLHTYTELLYLLTAIGLTPGGSTEHIYTQTIYKKCN